MSNQFVSTAEFQDMLRRMDDADFNVKDLNALRDIWKRDYKYLLAHPFWGVAIGKLMDLAEIGLIKKNMGGI